LNNGEEYLFVGDIVWSMDNIRKLKGKPYLVNLMFLKENRELVASQIRVLHNLVTDPANRIHIVVAHDLEQLNEYKEKGIIKDGFVH